MARRSRISLTTDTLNHILIIRFFNQEGDGDDLPDLIEHLQQVHEPWTYDAIFDFRRYEADLSRDRMSFQTRKWTELTGGRDSGKSMALITPDPNLQARLGTMIDVMPNRQIAIFDTFDEGLDWIKATGIQASGIEASGPEFAEAS